MSRYLVEANGYFIVTVSADSALRAEHMILDLTGFETALAFNLEDPKETRTDTFRGAIRDGATVSLEELAAAALGLDDAYKAHAQRCGERQKLLDEMEKLEKRLCDLRLEVNDAERAIENSRAQIREQMDLIHTPAQARGVLGRGNA